MEVPKNCMVLRKLGLRNIAQYNVVNVSFPAFVFHQYSLLLHYLPCLQERGEAILFGQNSAGKDDYSRARPLCFANQWISRA